MGGRVLGSSGRRNVAVSVIVPVYNMEDKLGRALDSALGQTLGDIEIVCVDDGSTDGSLRALNDYAARDARVVVVSQENAGPGLARNAGMRAARGAFLFFLDPDDWLPSDDVLGSLYEAALKSGARVVGGNLTQADDDGRSWGLDTRRDFSCEGWLRFSQVEDCFGYTRYIFDRELLAGHGVLFPAYRRGQDPVFMTRVMDCVDDFYVIPLPVYVYRKGVGHVRWTVLKACDHYGALGEVLAFSGARTYRYMHSGAAAAVFNKELLILALEDAGGGCFDCLDALDGALCSVKPSLLLNVGAYDGFRRLYEDCVMLLGEDGERLGTVLTSLKRKQLVHDRLVALVRRFAPALSWELQKRHSAPTGNYEVTPAALEAGRAETARGCSYSSVN